MTVLRVTYDDSRAETAKQAVLLAQSEKVEVQVALQTLPHEDERQGVVVMIATPRSSTEELLDQYQSDWGFLPHPDPQNFFRPFAGRSAA